MLEIFFVRVKEKTHPSPGFFLTIVILTNQCVAWVACSETTLGGQNWEHHKTSMARELHSIQMVGDFVYYDRDYTLEMAKGIDPPYHTQQGLLETNHATLRQSVLRDSQQNVPYVMLPI